MDVCTYADIGPLVQQKADPHMAEDPQVMNVVRQLDEACREIGFFYVVGVLLPRLLGFALFFGFLNGVHYYA
jgi:isopenicillin N synthase-like dioxygenase